MLRLEIKIKNRSGALHDAAATLAEAPFNLNILFAECAPSGHNHATWNVLTSAESEEVDNAIRAATETRARHELRPNDPLAHKLADRLADKLFEECARIKEMLLQLGKDKNFLHMRTVDPRYSLYRPDEMPESVQSAAREAKAQPVRCQWLQNHAFHWLFAGDLSTEDSKPLELLYRQVSGTLAEAEAHDLVEISSTHTGLLPAKPKLLAALESGNFTLPFATVAAFSRQEHYLRIALSEHDRHRDKVSVTVPYLVELENSRKGSEVNSKGLLARVCGVVQEKTVDLIKVSNSIAEKTQSKEQGLLQLIGCHEQHVKNDIQWRDELQRTVQEAVEGLSAERVTVLPKGIHYVFISSRDTFLTSHRGELEKRARFHGFEAVIAQGASSETPFVVKDVQDKISRCHAFLLIAPKLSTDADTHEEDVQWLQYEAGFAHGMDLPSALCFDTAHRVRLSQWVERFRMFEGQYLRQFDSGEPDSLQAALDETLSTLQRTIAKRRR